KFGAEQQAPVFQEQAAFHHTVEALQVSQVQAVTVAAHVVFNPRVLQPLVQLVCKDWCLFSHSVRPSSTGGNLPINLPGEKGSYCTPAPLAAQTTGAFALMFNNLQPAQRVHRALAPQRFSAAFHASVMRVLCCT